MKATGGTLFKRHISALEPPCRYIISPPFTGNTDHTPQEWQERREGAVTRAAELLRVSKTVWFEDSVHDVPLQRPEQVAQVIGEHIRHGFFDG